MLKKVIISLAILLFLFFVFIAWGLYLTEIEDHYGDLQEIYFESKSGDLIINKQTKNFGIISKSWKRANIITKQHDTLDLYTFINEDKYEVFRSDENLILNKLDFDKIIRLKSKKTIESVLHN
ncbi:hypothetical protein [Flavobacterium sp. ASV13]|uniref:hypothetical protein n=1 Tax=Flavobacterium sp. ASV13 TaxID=1506583 RepID=UPI00054E229E|nr:hypothetical protein [Flavobacterium sp. ASV13]